jgi:serine/threonine protein kinase
VGAHHRSRAAHALVSAPEGRTGYTQAVKFNGPLLNDRWRLGARMGAGAQARTYRARDDKSRDGRVVVIKQFELKSKESNWKNFDLFEREVRVLKSLRHPGIPRFIESFESEPGVFNLVIEKMSGATLRSIATKARFTGKDLRDILARVLELLDYIHHHDPPVIHRDIKPANLLRDAKGNIALVDFGGVRDALRESGGSTIVGTFGYMAPEQLHGQATPATDIYGLGATIVALAGKVEPENVPRKGLRMDLRRHLKDLDDELIEVLEAMTEPDPDLRPQSARDVSRLLARRAERAIRRRAERAIRSIGPAPDESALQRMEQSAGSRHFDEVGDMLASVPQPFGLVLRIFLLTFAIGGYVGLTVLQAVFLPVIFALVSAFASDSARPKIAATRSEVKEALNEGKEGFRHLQRRCLPGGNDIKKLPRP